MSLNLFIRVQAIRLTACFVYRLIHGYYVVYVTDIDTQWWHGDVGEEEAMWVATGVKDRSE